MSLVHTVGNYLKHYHNEQNLAICIKLAWMSWIPH